MDYHSGSYSVIFPAGVTLATFRISLTDDNILEGNENFLLTINETSLPGLLTRSHPDEATVTVVDNDCKMSYVIKA